MSKRKSAEPGLPAKGTQVMASITHNLPKGQATLLSDTDVIGLIPNEWEHDPAPYYLELSNQDSINLETSLNFRNGPSPALAFGTGWSVHKFWSGYRLKVNLDKVLPTSMYPDQEFSRDELPQALGWCGQWALLGECEGGHRFAKLLNCGREWCPKCRELYERKRFAKLLPKIQQFRTMGYLVVTIPPSYRDLFRNREGLLRVKRAVTRALVSMGYRKGIPRWHFFGDPEAGRRPKYHPHLNVLFKAGFLDDKQLRALRKAVARELCKGPFGYDPTWKHLMVELDIHYSYTLKPSKMLRLLRYVTRATFLDWRWDGELALSLFRSHNCDVWGSEEDWSEGPAWQLPERLERELGLLESLRESICPYCHTPIHWDRKTLLPADQLTENGYISLAGEYYCLSPPSPEVESVKSIPH